MSNYSNSDYAYRRVIDRLNADSKANYVVHEGYDKRHCIMKPNFVYSEEPSYYAIFKKETFRSFSHWFPSVKDNPEFKGEGDSSLKKTKGR